MPHRHPTPLLGSALAAGLLLAAALPAAAQRLDSDFGVDGLVVFDPGEPDTSVFAAEVPAFDGDGGILVFAGGQRSPGNERVGFLGKLDDSGAPVAGFASAGFRLLSANEPRPRAILHRDDGRIWVATVERLDLGGGEADYGVAYRFNANGSIDTSFDFDGRRVLFELGAGGDVTITAAADGGLFAVPAIDLNGDLPFILKLDASGALDSSTIPNGRVGLTLPAGAGRPVGVRMAELDDGTLLAQGLAVRDFGQPTQELRCVLWRMDAGGLRLGAFGDQGRAIFEMVPGVPNSVCVYLALDGEAVVVAGQTGENDDPDQETVNGALARVMLDDGSFDPGFGTAGRVVTAADPVRYDGIIGLALDAATRRIVVSHQGFDSPDNLLGRYDADSGQPDATLGVDGRTSLMLDFGDGPEVAWLGRVAIDPSGRTLLTGSNFTGGASVSWLVRLAGPDVFADGFEP